MHYELASAHDILVESRDDILPHLPNQLAEWQTSAHNTITIITYV